jgi:SAM-dependent methyltransferase
LNIPAGGIALDVGCGPGTVTASLARAAGPGALTLGLDISEAMLVAIPAICTSRISTVWPARWRAAAMVPAARAADENVVPFGIKLSCELSELGMGKRLGLIPLDLW